MSHVAATSSGAVTSDINRRHFVQHRKSKNLQRQSSFSTKERIYKEKRGRVKDVKKTYDCNGKTLYLVQGVNTRTTSSREKRLNWDSKNLNVKDSGLTGRIFKHILMGHLGVVLFEMTLYIFIVNVVFALIFTLVGGCCDETNNFWDNFNFSFQTFTTTGYGELYPHGTAANIINFFQGIHNLIITTIFAGVVFTKFIKPRWKFAFSDVIVVYNVRDVPTLCVRFGNIDGEFNNMHSVTATMFLKRTELDDQGKMFRAVHQLDLVIDSRFELRDVWTIQHRIDPDSPLFYQTYDEIKEVKSMIYVTVMGVDAITEEQLVKTTGYFAEDIEYGYKFMDQVKYLEDINLTTFDYGALSKTLPAPVFYPKDIQIDFKRISSTKPNGLDEISAHDNKEEEKCVVEHKKPFSRKGSKNYGSKGGKGFMVKNSLMLDRSSRKSYGSVAT